MIADTMVLGALYDSGFGHLERPQHDIGNGSGFYCGSVGVKGFGLMDLAFLGCRVWAVGPV